MTILTGKPFKRFVQVISFLFLITFILLLFFWEIEEKVPSKGQVENKQQIIVRSLCEKTVVDEIRYSPGSEVKKGDVIISLADIRDLKHQIKEIDLRLSEGRKSFARMTKLHASKLISDAQHEKLELQLKLAENTLERLKQEYEKLKVKAPFDGKIINFHIKLQELVRIGSKLFTIIGNQDKIIKCIIPQSLADGLIRGQKVNIKSKLKNYLRYRVYNGYLMSIAPFSKEEGDAVYYELAVGILDGEDELPVGSTALCEIVKGKQPLFFMLLEGRKGK